MSISAAPRKARASRKPRLPVMVLTKAPIPAPNWIVIEAETGPLAPEQRDRIVAILARYGYEAPPSRSVPPANSALGRLLGIEEALFAFQQAAFALRNTILSPAPGEAYARSLIHEHMRESIGRNTTIDEMRRMVEDITFVGADLLFATKCSVDDMAGDPQPEVDEKRAWQVMICELRDFADDIGMSLVMNNKKDACESQFIRFIIAIHGALGDVGGWRPGNPDSVMTEAKKALKLRGK